MVCLPVPGSKLNEASLPYGSDPAVPREEGAGAGEQRLHTGRSRDNAAIFLARLRVESSLLGRKPIDDDRQPQKWPACVGARRPLPCRRMAIGKPHPQLDGLYQ